MKAGVNESELNADLDILCNILRYTFKKNINQNSKERKPEKNDPTESLLLPLMIKSSGIPFITLNRLNPRLDTNFIEN
jgi:hypothetical protein